MLCQLKKNQHQQQTKGNMDRQAAEAAAPRRSLLPLKDAECWEWYKLMQACFWTAEEIDLSHDHQDMQRLNPGEVLFLEKVLSFFNIADSVVNENISMNFQQKFDSLEIRYVYVAQEMMEQIHTETYALLIEELIKSPERRLQLQSEVVESPSIALKIKWCEKYMHTDIDLAQQLLAFSAVEGIFFSSSFACIYWFKKRGLMPGLCFSNELIARDEGLHTNFAVFLLKNRVQKPTQEKAFEIIDEAVSAECCFVREALPSPLLGMNQEQMSSYVRFVADRLLHSLGYEQRYGDKLPPTMDFMELISMEGKTNFFEKKVSEYQKAGVKNSGAAQQRASSSRVLDQQFTDTDF